MSDPAKEETTLTSLRERVQEITAEYWDTRDSQPERVAVAQLALVLAKAEADLASALESQRAALDALEAVVDDPANAQTLMDQFLADRWKAQQRAIAEGLSGWVTVT